VTLLLIAIFGALGCVVRFVSEYVVRRHHPTLRPWATVAANTVGSALAGWAAYRLIGNGDLHLHEIVITGFCGGLTTFSSAMAIPALLQREHHVGYSVALVVTTPLLCGAAFAIGMGLAH
jgi:CrcB protein